MISSWNIITNNQTNGGKIDKIALAKSNGFTQIKDMQLGWNEIRDAGALAFVESKNFPNLEKLDLRGNFLAGKTKEALRSSLSHLKSLRIFQSE